MSGEVLMINVTNPSKSEIIITDSGKKYQKPNTEEIICGIIAAKTSANVVNKGIKRVSLIPINKAGQILNEKDKKIFQQTADLALEKSGLKQKGVTFFEVTGVNDSNKYIFKEYVNKSLPEKLKNIINKNRRLKNHFNCFCDNVLTKIAEGKNAMFMKQIDIIAINKEKYAVSAFHEMGHAINKHFSNFAKCLNKLKGPMAVFTPIIMAIAILKRKKAEGEKTDGLFDKTTTFIKNNCTKLTFAAFLPKILEEGLASLQGAKLAKGLVPAQQFKKVNKLQIAAWLTYLGSALAATAATATAGKVRDFIASSKEIKDVREKFVIRSKEM